MNISNLLDNIDEICASNMFLREAEKVENLKREIVDTFATIEDRIAVAECYGNEGKYGSEKIALALKDYLQNNINACHRCLDELANFY